MRNSIRSAAIFFIGLLILSLGYALILSSGLGNDTIGVLAQGIALNTGLTIGNGSQIINLAAIAIVFAGNRKLIGIGTIISVIGIGLLLDIYMSVTPIASEIGLQLLYLAVGIILGGSGIAITILSKFGASPIDCFMLLLSQKGNFSVKLVRITMDITMSIMGWLIGGNLGLGTVIAAVCIGPVIQVSLRRLRKV